MDQIREMYPWSSHWTEVPGLGDEAQHFIDEGQGEPILMLHGNPTWSFYYRELIRVFSGTNRVVVPDHIGSGLSKKPQDWSYQLKDHIDNIERLVDKLGLKGLTLVLHDWGGAIGMGLATRRPELIKRLVILNTAAFYLNDIPRRIQMCRLPVIGEWIVRRLNGFALPATWMASAKGLSKEAKKGYLYPYDSYENRVGVSAFVQDIPMEADHPSLVTLRGIEGKLSQIKVPTLILWGGRDFCFHKDFYTRWIEIYPQATSVWLEDAGHYVLEDAKERVIHEISSFLAAH